LSFVHDDPEFDDLLRIAADRRRLAVGLVEKEYWVTHVLWSLRELGLAVWLKGGTSLSKGFGLIERFSEDLDLKLEPGSAALPRVTNWRSEGTKATAERRAHFEKLVTFLDIRGMKASRDSCG
jgi:predicted nucleotidyltransferase component of viral defense system